MQILYCLSSCFNRCVATWYAMGFNFVWLGCLFFMLNKDDSELFAILASFCNRKLLLGVI